MSRTDLKAEAIPPLSARVSALRVLRALYPPNLLHILRSVNTDQLCSEREFLDRYPLGPKEWGVVFPHGMGDLYLTCAYAQAVLKERGGNGFVAFVRPHHAYIPTLFDAVSRIVPVSNLNLKRVQQNYHFEQGRLFSVFPLHNFMNVIGFKGVHFLDYYCLFLNLSLSTCPARPRPQTADELDAGRKLLAEHGLQPGKTVILAPGASSTTMVPEEFWSVLANELVGMGYDIVTNNPLGASGLAGVWSLDIPLERFIAVATAAGWLISMRSGLCELVAHADCRLTVIYPDEQDPWKRRLATGFSLVESGLRPDTQEIWYQAGKPEDAVGQIMAGLDVSGR